MTKKPQLLFILIFLLPFLLSGQIEIKGRVVYKLAGVRQVPVRSNSETVFTGRFGKFRIKTRDIGDTLFFGFHRSKMIVIKNRRRVVLRVAHPSVVTHGFCCVVAGTKITLSNGHEKNIETIGPGDSVLTAGSGDLQLEKSCVTVIDSVVHDCLIEVSFAGAGSLKSTDDHPYFVDGKGWCSFNPKSTFTNYKIPAKQLVPGDLCLYYENGELKKTTVKKILRLKGAYMTYNLTGLSKNHSYFANGILLSNESGEDLKN